MDAILGFAKGDENIAVRHRKRASVSIPPGADRRRNLQPDFNVRVSHRFDARASTLLREPDESHRFVQK